jgi:hypothetical protein
MSVHTTLVTPSQVVGVDENLGITGANALDLPGRVP